MRIRVLTVGETKTPYLREGEQDYLKRLRRYCKMETVSVQPEKMTVNKPDAAVIAKEGERLIACIEKTCRVVALDRLGKPWSSEDLAVQISVWQNRGVEHSVFVIGGPLGLGANVMKRADEALSLSKMTFAHEMAKLVLLEQLYRAFTILNGEKYHK
jgi:23S rRNA (pseudouridine1915-N3)-methyltransferase